MACHCLNIVQIYNRIIKSLWLVAHVHIDITIHSETLILNNLTDNFEILLCPSIDVPDITIPQLDHIIMLG